MKMVFKAFLKNIFGENLERYLRMVLIDLIVFGGLFFADFKIRIAPSVLYLMVSVSTAGVMWRALSSKESVVNMQNMVMLPFERRGFVFSYVAVLGLYTCLTKTAALLAVLFAVSYWNPIVVLGSALCAGNAVLVAAAVCVLKKYWYADGLWIICRHLLFRRRALVLADAFRQRSRCMSGIAACGWICFLCLEEREE